MKLLTKITLGAFALPAMQVVAQTTKPNIILIMTDQQSYNAISAHADMYGGSYFSTPNIDRLAKEGISFTRTYCANPVSVPSRFALFTGMFGGQYGIRENQCAEADETEVRAMLAQNGMGAVFNRGGYETYYGEKCICLSPPKRASLNLLLRQGMVLKLTLPMTNVTAWEWLPAN